MTDKTKKRIVLWWWILIVAPVVAVALLLTIVWAFADIPSIEELENPDSKLATQVIAEEGEILTTYHIENRTFVSYEELAPSLVQAAVATEDKPSSQGIRPRAAVPQSRSSWPRRSIPAGKEWANWALSGSSSRNGLRP